ncbi:MAG: aldo/keto reductase [Thermoanaerobaculaceae bacterium]|nr:aldo/keto reductase [Thermoanaerobaculaceae bacterium]
MEYRKLGKTNLDVSVIGFGAWAIGGDLWGHQDDEESIKALRKSVELGCNFIDTAAVYGIGHSEEVVSRFLKETKSEILIATKVPPKNFRWPAKKGTPINEAFPKDWIISETEKSLKRLKKEYVDLQQIHVWTEEWIDCDEWLSALVKLKEQGKIRFYGVSINAFDANSGVELCKREVVDTIQVVYNIFEQAPEDNLFPEAIKHNIGIIARVPLDESSLTGKLTKETKFDPDDFRSRYFKGERLIETVERVERVKQVAEKNKISLVELALRFSFSHPAVSTSIPGIRNINQAEMNISSGSKGKLTEEILCELKKHRWDRDWRI